MAVPSASPVAMPSSERWGKQEARRAEGPTGTDKRRGGPKARPGLTRGEEGRKARPGLTRGEEGRKARPGLTRGEEGRKARPGLTRGEEGRKARPGLKKEKERPMAGLQLSGVKKSFGAVDVIKGVDLDIKSGEFIVFVGPSG